MKTLLDDSELEELKIEDILKTDDKLIIHNRQGEKHIIRGELEKEIAAHDSIDMGQENAAKVHGMIQAHTQRYENGKHISDPDARARIASHKHNIADVAITKLMDSLNLIDLDGMEQKDIIRAAGTLANVVDKVTGGNKDGGARVELHLHAPAQRSIKEYGEVIDV